MAESTPGSAREEAERLVATALAATRAVAAGLGTGPTAPGGPVSGLISDLLGRFGTPGETADDRSGGGSAGPEPVDGSAGHRRFATGSAECCVCPICRAMAALRDPSPEFAERLATGAGDLAAGVASLLRAFATAGPTAPRQPSGASGAPASGPGDGPAEAGPAGTGTHPGPAGTTEPAGSAGTSAAAGEGDSAARAGHGRGTAGTGAGDSGDQVWRAATRTGHDSRPEPARDVWAAATTAASRSDAAGVTSPVEPAGGSPTVPAARAPEAPARADEGAPGDEA